MYLVQSPPFSLLIFSFIVLIPNSQSKSYRPLFSVPNPISSLRLYKTVFPLGIDAYKADPTARTSSPGPNQKSSFPSILSRHGSTLSTSASMSNLSNHGPSPTPNPMRSGFFGRWTGRPSSTSPILLNGPGVNGEIAQDGPVDELIIAGTAFGMYCYRFLRISLIDL
jgi:hypothetical protein